MKYFTVNELCVSGSYPKLVEVPKEGTNEYKNIVFLIENLLDPIREKLGRPVRVTSGYRPTKLNKAVGGAVNSNHLYGCAADIHTGNDSTDNIKIIEALLQLGYSYDEIIAEGAYFDKNDKLISAKWIHVALKPYNNRKKFLYTVDFKTYHQLHRNTVITK
jgi:hypothetical protein